MEIAIEDIPLERSDDPRRGSMPHLKAARERAEKELRGSVTCVHCRTRPATHVVDALRNPRAICGTCADEWRNMDPVDRMRARHADEWRAR